MRFLGIRSVEQTEQKFVAFESLLKEIQKTSEHDTRALLFKKRRLKRLETKPEAFILNFTLSVTISGPDSILFLPLKSKLS